MEYQKKDGDFIVLAGLWKKDRKGGGSFYSGALNTEAFDKIIKMDPESMVVDLYKVESKNPRAPSLRVCIRQKKNATGSGGGKSWRQKKDKDDDVPF